MHTSATGPLPAIRKIETSRDDLCAIEIAGRITANDVENAYGLIEAEFAGHDRIDLILRVADYKGFDWALAFSPQTLRRKMRAIGHLRRYAVIGGPAWLPQAIALVAPFVSTQVRHFALADEAAAWNWLDARPV